MPLGSTKKKILTVVALLIIGNVVVNVITVLPLSNMDFKILSIKFVGETKDFSVLSVKLLVRNNYWLPAKIPKASFRILDPQTNGLIGMGYMSPMMLDPGRMGILTITLKLYKTDATEKLIRTYLVTQKSDAKIRVEYPFSLFGLIDIITIPFDVSLSDILDMSTTGESVAVSISSFFPGFTIEKIELTRETNTYAEAKIVVSGVVPAELTQIGVVELRDVNLNMLTSTGHVLNIWIPEYILDSAKGSFNTTVYLRFIKGNALKNFLNKAVKEGTINGKIKGQLSLKIFGIEVEDAEVELDVSQFSESLVSPSTAETSSSVFGALLELLGDNILISSLDIDYLGKQIIEGETKYLFNADALITNNLNWTLGWGPIDINILGKNRATILKIRQDSRILLSSGETREFLVDAEFTENNDLYEFLDELLYNYEFNATLSGTVDIYFAGVWIEDIDLSKFSGEAMGEGGVAASFDEFVTQGFDVSNLMTGFNITETKYDIAATDRYIIIDSQITIVYEPMPLTIYEVRGDIIYDSSYIGSLKIQNIDLDKPFETQQVICRPIIEIRIKKDSPKLSEFIESFVKGTWAEKTDFVGSADIKFLNRTFYNIPIRVGGSMISLSDELSVAEEASKFYKINSVAYIGEIVRNDLEAYELLVNASIINAFSVELDIGPGDLYAYLPNDIEPVIEIIIPERVEIPPFASKSLIVDVYIYKTDSTRIFLNSTLHGESVDVIVCGNLTVHLSGAEINLENFQTNFVVSLIDSLTLFTSESTSAIYGGGGVQILNVTEFPDRIEIYVKTSVEAPIPMIISLMIADISLYEDSVEPPATIEIVKPIVGPGENDVVVRLILRNSSSEFVDFIRSFIYGNVSELYADIELGLSLFGWDFGIIAIDNFRIDLSSEATQQSALSAISLTDLFCLEGYRYMGETVVDGEEAFRFDVNVTFNNTIGISIEFWDTSIYVVKDDQKLIKIVLSDRYTLAAGTTEFLSISIYIFKGKEAMKSFLYDLAYKGILNATIQGTINIKIFGVEYPQVIFVQKMLFNISDGIGMTSYQDLGGLGGMSLQDISLIYDYQNETLLEVSLLTKIDRLPIKIFRYEVNISLDGWSDPAIILSSNSTIDLYDSSEKLLKTYIKTYKSDRDYTAEILKRIIESEFYPLVIKGEVYAEIFGVNITLPFEMRNISLMPNTQSVVVAGTLPSTTISINEFKYEGEEMVNGRKAYRFSASITLENPFGVNISIGPFSAKVIREDAVTVEILIEDAWILPKSTSNLTVDMYIYSGNETYIFLRDLIENNVFIASIQGYGNITVFGIKVVNINITYVFAYELSEELVGQQQALTQSALPMGQLEINHLSINTLLENDTLAEILIKLNLTNLYKLPATIWNLTAVLSQNGEEAIKARLLDILNLSKDFMSIDMDVLLYKKNVTADIIKGLIEGGAIVDINVSAHLMFLEWNFTVEIELKDIAYTSSSDSLSESIIPLNIENILVLERLEQIGPKTLIVEYTFNNFVNVSLGIDHLSFDVIYKNYTVVEICTEGPYNVEPGENITMQVKIEIKDTSVTQNFLEELLIEKQFNATVSGVASISLFGLNITQVPFARKIFIDLVDQALPQTAVAPAINITNAQLLSTSYDGRKLELNVSIEIPDVPVSIVIDNLNLTLRNNLGSVGYIWIPHAEMSHGENATINAVIALFDRPNNIPLERFIRELVEDRLLRINVSGSLDLTIFGYWIEGITIDLAVNQTLETFTIGTDEGGLDAELISSMMPLQDLFLLGNIEQRSFGSRQYYNLEANISVKNPIAAPIWIGNVDITVYDSGYEAIRTRIDDVYRISSDMWTNMSIMVSVYDTPGAKHLLESALSNGEINITIEGTLDLTFLGADIDDLYLNYSIYQTMNMSSQVSSGTNVIASNFFSYSINEIKIWGEDNSTANIIVDLNASGVPIFLKVRYMNLTISNDLGRIARLYARDIILSPLESTNITINITIFKGSLALKEFIEDYIGGVSTVVDVSGAVTVQLFDESTQYLTLNLTLDLKDLAFNMTSSNNGSSIIPVNLQSLIQYKDMKYIGSRFDSEEGVRYYILRVTVDFINKFNISLAVYGLKAKLLRNDITVVKIEVPQISISASENTTIAVDVLLVDRPETAEFLEDLINNYSIEVDVDILVDEVNFFGVSIRNISLRQVFGWSMSEQLESMDVQETALSLFNMSIGGITVLDESDTTATLNVNITIFGSKVPVQIYGFNADIIYESAKVANVFIDYLELSMDHNMTFNTNITIYKLNKPALQGFLQDLLVKKNVTMDVWGSTTINLFGSDNLILDIEFKYNNTRYSVSDYYEALMEGEVDASTLLNNIIEYHAENVSWEIVSEDRRYVVLRLIEPVSSSLNIKIFRMETTLHMEPLNEYTAFGIQTIVGTVQLRADETTNITIEIIFMKNRYLQEFLDATLHDWSIDVWASTKIDLEIFGVNITDLEALSAKFMYIITPDIIQGALDSIVSEEVNSINANVVALIPIGYGTYYADDLYGGIENATNYADPVWENDPTTINLWNYYWILLQYHQVVGDYGFNVTLENFKAIMVYSGKYYFGNKAGQQASGSLDDFFGEIYIENLTLVEGIENVFDAYVRLWRVNRFRDFENSTLKDWLWSMVKYYSYNFSITNVMFDLRMWGCYIKNITLKRLNFTGIYDISSLSQSIKFKGMSGLSVALDLNKWVYVTVNFKIEVPISPEWLVYYSMLITWDDDPIFFSDTDVGDDPPTTGGWTSGAYKSSEAEEFKALSDSATPLAHDVARYYDAPQIKDAPSSGLPSYAEWFGSGGTKELSATIDIEWTDAWHDYIGNAYLDQQYDDEYLNVIGRAEEEDVDSVLGISVLWGGTENGDMWTMVMLSYEVEIVMFWWVLYYYTPTFFITSGDQNLNVAEGKIVLLYDTVQWEFHDANNVYSIILMKDVDGNWVIKPHPNADYTVNATVSGMQFVDAYDGTPDALEPDNCGNY